jgi:tetratricopeptide (TPR) repeat protein
MLSEEEIENLVSTAADVEGEDKQTRAWEAAEPLRNALGEQLPAAEALCHLIDIGAFSIDQNIELAEQIANSYPDNTRILSVLGDAFQSFQDMRYLNAAPPNNPFLVRFCEKLRDLSKQVQGEDEYRILKGLATAARILGRDWDEVTDATYRRLLEIKPERWQLHYDYGLFLKTRGRFAEGQAANQRAFELSRQPRENVIWNLGICGTGAGDGATALRVWKDMGQTIKMGRFGLPEGRSMEGRLPTTSHGENTVPVFPHLATLRRGNYRIYRFAGTHPEEGYIGNLGDTLESDTVVYVHSEQFQELCTGCWESSTLDHAEHQTAPRRVVTGKVCAPPETSDRYLLAELDALFGDSEAQLFIPELSRRCGDSKRAEVEERRTQMIDQAWVRESASPKPI